MAAFDPATLDRWRVLAIVDRDGTTVGTISEFYLDRQTGHPTWALVNTGLFGATQTFVALVHATEVDDGLQVPYEKSHIKDAPRVDPHGELTPDEEATLFAHYGVDYYPSTSSDPDLNDAPATVQSDPWPGGSPTPPDPEARRTDPGSAGSPEAGTPEGEFGGSQGAVTTEGRSAGSPEVGTTEGELGGSPGTGGPESGVGGSAGIGRPGAGGAVPAEPEPIDLAGGASGSDGGAGAVPHEPETVEADEAMPADPDGDGSPAGQDREEPTGAEPGLSRPAPVEPGLPGSTTATSSGPNRTTIDDGHSAGASSPPTVAAQQAPDEPEWPPPAPSSFERHEPAPPTGASDRWREAKLAAERDRIARAAAAPPEERSPLERAKRRLERLVGGGQEPDPEPVPADREAAERARRSRLGLDEDDPHRR